MYSFILGSFGVLLIVYHLLDYKIKNKKQLTTDKILTMTEKKFFMSLSKALPPDYTVAYQTDVYDLKKLAQRLNIDKSIYKSLKKTLKKRSIDFVILDNNFDVCLIIDFNTNENNETDHEFSKICKDLDIEIFKYSPSKEYDFKKIINYLTKL